MSELGSSELFLLLVIGLIVLGPKRLPGLARSLGRGLAEFREASSNLSHQLMGEDATPGAPALGRTAGYSPAGGLETEKPRENESRPAEAECDERPVETESDEAAAAKQNPREDTSRGEAASDADAASPVAIALAAVREPTKA